MFLQWRHFTGGAVLSVCLMSAGCLSFGWPGHVTCHDCGTCGDAACGTCEPATCSTCEPAPCSSCGTVGCGTCCLGGGWWSGWLCRRSNAIPDALPLGSTIRSYYQIMQTNAEAVDFVLNDLDFVGQTAELTPDGKDKILEIAVRMKSDPFPVLIERSTNNSDPELDALRRNLVAQILGDLGNPDAQQRTVVGIPYGPGYNTLQAEPLYYQHVGSGSNNSGFGTYGGFGAGGGGGIGLF